MILQELTSAQQHLWHRAEEAEKEKCYEDALFFSHALLRSAPDFLEARVLARRVARIVTGSKEVSFFRKIKLLLQRQLVKIKVLLLLGQQRPAAALMVLEDFLSKAPGDPCLNEWMGRIAAASSPPSPSLALFALEAALLEYPQKKKLHFQIARVALLPDEYGQAWNLERAIEAYQAILTQDPHAWEAKQGLKNTLALLSMKKMKSG